MADYAASFTPRIIFHYVSGGVGHTMQFRGFRGETQAVVGNRGRLAAFGLASEIAAWLPDDFQWLSAVYIEEDDDLSTPDVVPLPVTGSIAVATLSPEDKARFLGFAGRGTGPGASKASVRLFGVSVLTDDAGASVAKDFVITGVESALVADAVTAMDAANTAAIDNTRITWYNRATVKIHDYWLRQIRKGIVS